MTQGSLHQIGTRVQYHGMMAKIITSTDNDVIFQFEDSSLELEIVKRKKLERELGNVLHFVHPETILSNLPKDLSIEAKALILRREQYVKELTRLAGIHRIGGIKVRTQAIENVARNQSDLQPPSPSTLARWAKDAILHSLGVARSILANNRKQKSTRYDHLKEIALACFDEYYLVASKPYFQTVFDIFVDRVKEQFGGNTSYPCYATFVGWIKDICPISASLKQDGKKVTNSMMRNAIDKLIVDHPLERIECDGISLAIGLVDDEGNFLGTAKIFFVIDCYTRCILGYQLHIGSGEPSSCIIDAFRHALCPKPTGTYNENCKSDWPMYGVFESIAVDGGPGYVSLATNGFLLRAGMKASIVETYAGWKKPFIERFNYTVRSNFASLLPGYCGHDSFRQQDVSLKKQATLTPAVFKNLLELWIVDEYHQTRHSGLKNKTPYDVWKASFPDPSRGPMLPANYDLIKLPCGEVKWPKISGPDCHHGIVINNVRYNDGDLKLKMIGLKLLSRGEEPIVRCDYSITDISQVTITDPFNDEQYVIPATDPSITPQMSLAEFNAKHVKRYENKGYGHKRVVAESQELKDAKDANKLHIKQIPRTKQRKANPSDIAEAVEKQQAKTQAPQAEAPKDHSVSADSNPFGDIDLGNLEGHKHD